MLRKADAMMRQVAAEVSATKDGQAGTVLVHSVNSESGTAISGDTDKGGVTPDGWGDDVSSCASVFEADRGVAGSMEPGGSISVFDVSLALC